MFLILLLLTTLLSLGKSSTCSEMADSNIRSRVNDYMDNYHLIDPSSYACGNIETWNIQRVTNLNYMFQQRNMVNINLSNWDTSSVTTLQGTFYYATSFTGDGLSNWNTSRVTSLRGTFSDATSFTGDGVSNWDTSSVTSLFQTFYGATSLTNCSKLSIYTSWDSQQSGIMEDYSSWASLNCYCAENEYVCFILILHHLTSRSKIHTRFYSFETDTF